MNKLTTKKAFEQLISTRGWWKDTGFEKSTANSYVNRFKQKKLPLEKIEEILLKAGYKVKQEKEWTK